VHSDIKNCVGPEEEFENPVVGEAARPFRVGLVTSGLGLQC
jgi:hypothetical protein